MNSFLLNRQLGSISPQALAQAQNDRSYKALQLAPDVVLRQDADSAHLRPNEGIAHRAGINSIAIDRFEGRYLISAGADSSIAVWDLEEPTATEAQQDIFKPIATRARTSTTESLGITHISFYPFDSLALLTSGYDHTLKLISSETLATSATFDIGSIVYSHSTSTVASHLLVACASQHPAVRLVDLHSGANTHSLAGHAGSVLAVAWHPNQEHVLASAATDGVIRLWDIRRSANSLGVLDAEDSIGIAGYDGKGTGARRRERGKSHRGAINGLAWTATGEHLISVGHDERMRVWDMLTGANTLANFGPSLKNTTTTPLIPVIVPAHLPRSGHATIYYPNPREILAFDIHSGTLQSRLRVQAAPGAQTAMFPGGDNVRDFKLRTTALAWRAHHIEMYSAHGDGTIRCWRPRTQDDVFADEQEAADDIRGHEAAERKRKREEFNEIVQELTKKKITFI